MSRRYKLCNLPTYFQPGFMRTLNKRTALYIWMKASFEKVVEDLGGDYSAISHVKLALIEEFLWTQATIKALNAQFGKDPECIAEISNKLHVAKNTLASLADRIGIEKVVDPRKAYKQKIGA